MRHYSSEKFILRTLVFSILLGWFKIGFCADFLFGAGVHVMPGWTALRDVRAAVDDVGFNSFRDDVFWHSLERERGSLSVPKDKEDFIAYIKSSPGRGVRPVVILDYGNPLYESGDFPLEGEALEGFLRYVRYVANELKGRGVIYEVWNEWNIGLGIPEKLRAPGKADAYVGLLRKVAPILREVDPGATILSTSVARLDERWLNDYIRAGGLALVDGVSLHPYVWSRRNSKPEDAIEWVDKISALIRERSGGRDFPIYITEIGWPNHAAKGAFSEDVSAAYATRFMFLAKSRASIRGVWWYDLKDDGAELGNWEHHFGLLRLDGSKKPAYEEFKRLSRVFKMKSSAKEIVLKKNVRLVQIDLEGGDRVSVIWSANDAQEVVQVVNCDLTVFSFDSSSANFCALAKRGVVVGAKPLVLMHKAGGLQFSEK
jgi:polysaccharide biosynthesis protein PslG